MDIFRDDLGEASRVFDATGFGHRAWCKMRAVTRVERKGMFDSGATIEGFDEEIWLAIQNETVRQEEHVELIASENYASPRILEAQGSVLTNKYAEGYPAKRYYGGCEFVDKAEELALERVKKLFNCKYANVQPHSGAQANGAVYLALLKPGDTIMGMSLNSGGHLTHGSKASISGKWFNSIAYDVDEKSELIIDIEKSLMATCCWSGTVYDHGNKEMEIQIAGMVDQGKTKLEIINFYTDKYGERV